MNRTLLLASTTSRRAGILGTVLALVLLWSVPATASASGSITCHPATQASLQQGSSVTENMATLVVPDGTCPVTVSFSAYALPSGEKLPFEEQVLVDNVTGTYGPGTYHLTLDTPETCGYQTDLYLGAVLYPLGPNAHGGGILIDYALENLGEPCGDVPGECYNVDFETDGLGNDLSTGQVIDDEYADFGVTLSEASGKKLLVFDTGNPTGGDSDLGTPGSGEGNTSFLGNVLIISEDGDESDPDDDAAGGTIIFDFDTPVTVAEVNLLDIDSDEAATIRAYDSGGGLIATVNAVALGNNSFQSLAVGAEGVSRLEVEFSSSGALAGVVFCEEPQDICDLDQGPPEIAYAFDDPRHVVITVTDDTGIASIDIEITNPDGGAPNLELVESDFVPGAMIATFRYRLVSFTENAEVRVVATDLCDQVECPSDDGSPDELPPTVVIEGQGDIAVGYAEHPVGLESFEFFLLTNVTVTQNTFVPGAMRADFQLDKINTNQSGRFGLIAASACNSAVIDPDLRVDYPGNNDGPFLEAEGLVVVEAESFTGTGEGSYGGEDFAWEPIGWHDGSSGDALQGLPNIGGNALHTTFGPRLDYAIDFATPGSYIIWARASADVADDNSVHVGFDGERLSPRDGLAVPSNSQWIWSNRVLLNAAPIRFEVTEPGVHTFNVWMREDGARIDKFIITQDGAYRPEGEGPAESIRGSGDDAGRGMGDSVARGMASGDASEVASRGDSGLPTELALAQNYPNPVAASTTVEVALPAATDVRLEVYNLLGQRISVLADGTYDAGTHRFAFDARGLASGTYVYRLATPERSITKRMTVMN